MRTKEALAARKAEGQKLGRQEGFCPKLSVLHEKKEPRPGNDWGYAERIRTIKRLIH